MALIKCSECNQMFDNSLTICPNCGCPFEVNKVSPVHDSFNEETPYSPFHANSWFFQDPWPIKNYPIGMLHKRHPLLGWLLGPWHLTCKNKKEQEEYAVINNIFYAANLIWKIFLYSSLWHFCKFIFQTIAGLSLICFIIWLTTDRFGDGIEMLGIGFALILFVLLCIISTIVYIVGLGKALHRYWPKLHNTFRRIHKRYWNAMSNKE